MKKLIALLMAVVILVPGVAFAGASTDAALGLGAFAVFNQILGGVCIFHRGAVVAAPPVVYAPPPVVYSPPPRYVPAPRVIVKPYPVYAPGHRHVVVHEHRAFCPPGHAKKGWCHRGSHRHHGWRH